MELVEIDCVVLVELEAVKLVDCDVDCVTLVLCVKLVDWLVELVEIEVDCETVVLVDSETLVDSVRLVELD